MWEMPFSEEISRFWRERKRWRFAWSEKQTRVSLCFDLFFENPLAAFVERRMPAWASIPAGRNFRGL